jgi:hypothetical protein
MEASMTDPFELDYLKPFIDSTVDAAARFRRVLIVMITVSILALLAFWNSLDETWFNQRITAARNGESYMILKDLELELARTESSANEVENDANPGLLPWVIPDRRWRLAMEKKRIVDEAKKILINRFRATPVIATAADIAREREANIPEKNVSMWIKSRKIPNKEDAAEYALKLEEARTNNVLLIHIPLAGGVFDINSLALWTGITFAVILLMFRFSLWREYNNLKLAFMEARPIPQHLKYCYMSLAMQQVLTVPPALSDVQPDLKPAGRVVQFLYFPPFFILLLIILNDVRTLDIGSLFNSWLAFLSIVVSVMLLVTVLALTWRCLKLSLAIDREWNTARQEICGPKVEDGLEITGDLS